jgi:hypothetical protein
MLLVSVINDKELNKINELKIRITVLFSNASARYRAPSDVI